MGGDSRYWPIAGSSVDTITAFDVLEHIPDDTGALRNIFSSLQPGGILILSVPAYQWMWSEHDEALHHQRRYTRSEILALAGSSGFCVEYASYHNCLLFPLSLLLRMLSRWSGGRLGISENAMPAKPINTLLRIIYSLEGHIVKRRWRLPFGLSIVAVLRKPEHSPE